MSETIARFRMCRSGDRIGVACSGGPDSVALLEALLALAPRLEINVGVAHLNHGLRGVDSDGDEAFVRALAEKHGIEPCVEAADVAALADAEGRNLEEAGRNARYEWFGTLIEQGVFDRIATGHTRSDQAETVLFRLLRGAGPDGLSSIRPVRQPGVIRPLLGVDRADVEAFLAARAVGFRVDESNHDPRFARNRIRRDLLPRLERDWNPRTSQALARLGEQAAEDAAYWRTQVEQCESSLLHTAPGGLFFAVQDVAGLEPALLRRLLRRGLERVGGSGRYDFHHLAALRRLVEAPDSGSRLSLPGVTVERSCGKVRVTAADHSTVSSKDEPAVLQPPEELSAPDGRTRIRVEHRPQQALQGSYTKRNCDQIDCSKAAKPFVLRSWRPGDRIRLAPRSAPRKLGDLLQSANVAVWDRAGWPVLAPLSDDSATPGQVFWARGFGASSEFRPAGNIVEVLRVFEFDEAGRAWTGPQNWEVISAGLQTFDGAGARKTKS